MVTFPMATKKPGYSLLPSMVTVGIEPELPIVMFTTFEELLIIGKIPFN